MPFPTIQYNLREFNLYRINSVAPIEDIGGNNNIVVDNYRKPNFWQELTVEKDLNQKKFKAVLKIKLFYDRFFAPSEEKTRLTRNTSSKYNSRSTKQVVYTTNDSRDENESQSSSDISEYLNVIIAVNTNKSKKEKKSKEKMNYGIELTCPKYQRDLAYY